MKSAKTIFYITFILFLVFFSLNILIEFLVFDKFLFFTKFSLSAIVIALFTGFIISFVIALANYFHEKDKFIQNSYTQLSIIYNDAHLSHMFLDKIIEEANAAKLYESERLLNVLDISLKEAIEAKDKIVFSDYNPFFTKSNQYYVLTTIKAFCSNVTKLKTGALKIHVLFMEIKNHHAEKMLLAQQFNIPENERDAKISELNNLINLKDKHIYGLIFELRALLYGSRLEIIEKMSLLSDFYKFEMNWADLQRQIENTNIAAFQEIIK